MRPPITTTYSCTNLTVPPITPDPNEELSLSQLVDLGLYNSPRTRIVWSQAKQAAADVGTARGAYLPAIFLEGFWIKEQFPEVDLGIEFLTQQNFLGAVVGTSYLLYDFGGRNANLMSATAALDAINWIYNWEVQTVMINVIQSYYNYINMLGMVAADEATVEDNLTTVEAASSIRKAGVQSLSDELQAHTSLLQSQITLEEDRGKLNVAMATLLQSIGLPPDRSIDVAALPREIAVDGICSDMATILAAAKEHRADLMALRSHILDHRFKIGTARSAMLPTLNTLVEGGKMAVNGMEFVNAYTLRFSLNAPLFSAFADINELRKAQADLLKAQAELDGLELHAFLSVLSDYYELIANTQILKYSYKFIKIAEKNRELAFANYKAGINTIVDLMTANNALQTARKQLVEAKINFLTSLANLVYETGGLTIEDITATQRVVPPCLEMCEEEDPSNESWDS